MKVLLTYPDIQTVQFPHFQHGVASVSATLKQGGHETSLIYLSQEITDDEFIEQTQKASPDMVAFSSITLQYSFARRYAKAVKQRLGLPVVIGGIHATIAPESVMGDGTFDYLIQAEGEHPLLELADTLEADKDPSEIMNLWLRTKNGVIRNPLRPPEDVESLPFVDRELFDNEVLMRDNDRQVSVMASRGCPYACTYCCNTVLSRLAGGPKKWLRQRKVDSVISEIRYLHERFPEMKSMIFMDEIFTLNKKWINEFCEKYKATHSTPFQIFLRVETVDKDMLTMMHEAGLYAIIVGVESGNERIRDEVLNRKMSNEQIIRVFEWADELGIETWDLNMVGLPGETETEIRETMELNRRLRPHHVTVSMFYPFPGTPLYDRCKDEGLLQVADTTSIFLNTPTLDLPGLPKDKLQELFNEFLKLGSLLDAQKGAMGYYDLTAHFNEAVINSGGKDYLALLLIRIYGEDRMSILMHPQSSAKWRMTVEPDTIMRFGIAFSPDVYDKPGKGCTYTIRIKSRLRREKTVYSKYFDPKHNPDERGWVDQEIDLSKFAGKKIEMTLETSTPPGENEYCVAFWSRPHLAKKGDMP